MILLLSYSFVGAITSTDFLAFLDFCYIIVVTIQNRLKMLCIFRCLRLFQCEVDDEHGKKGKHGGHTKDT